MPRIAITGHMNLTGASGPLVFEAIKAALRPHADSGLVGVSCLARGADSIFAQAVLDAGGALEVVLPSTNYRETKVKPDHAPAFDHLLSRAARISVQPRAEANREAYEAANEVLLSSADLLFAVWDGHPGVDRGGTAALVEEARRRGMPIEVIWPTGAAREQST